MEGPRACRPDELDGLRMLVNRVFRSGGESCMFAEFPTLFAPENCERLRIIADGGRLVSAINYVARRVVVYGNTLTVGSLGAVATYEEYRGRGYATALLEDTFACMRDEAVDVVLISGQRGLYQRAGCAIGGHEMRIGLDRTALGGAPLDEAATFTEAADADVPALIAIHQREPARYLRSTRDWEQFQKVNRLTIKGVEPPFGVRRCFIVRHGDVPLAYLVPIFGRETGSRNATIVEFAGARRAVIEGLRLLAEAFDLRAISGRTLPEDADMLDLLASMGIASERHLLGGHRLSILNDDILLRYQPWLDECVGRDNAAKMRVSRSGGEWSLTFDGASLPIGGLEAINDVLFGDAVRDVGATAGLSRATANLWKSALPLPWVLPGMNYI